MTSYDPKKKYEWTPETKFELSGAEFGLVLNTIRSILSTNEARNILMADRVSDIMENLMAKGVEEGTIVEIKQ